MSLRKRLKSEGSVLFMNTSKSLDCYIGKHYKFYSTGEFIGAGGNGSVHKVKCDKLPGNYVIKILSEKSRSNNERKERFKREIDAIKKINTRFPNKYVVECIDNDDYWYVMPELTCLDKYLRKDGFGFKEKFRIIVSLADILAKLHENGYCHRDIKPSNILLDASGNVFLCDWGLVWNDDFLDITLTNEGLGPANTRPPECKRGYAHEIPNEMQMAIDVYEFAKTAWMILKSAKYCYDGQYDYADDNIFISHRDLGAGVRDYVITLGPLHEFLELATHRQASRRPKMSEVCSLLQHLITDNQNTELIKKWEWKTNIKRNRYIFNSDIEGYTDVVNIEHMINGLRDLTELKINDNWFVVIKECTIYDVNDGVIIIKDSNNNSFFIKVKALYLDKTGTHLENNRLVFEGFYLKDACDIDDIYGSGDYYPGVPIVDGSFYINRSGGFDFGPVL